MGISDLFSKRQKRMRSEVPDVYTYDELPHTLRVQIIHIWTDTLGSADEYFRGNNSYQYKEVINTYKKMVELLCREYGLFQLPTANNRSRMYLEELADYLLQENDVEKQIDIVELSFQYIDKVTRDYNYMGKNNAPQLADSAIVELNIRFKEHGVGYQFSNNQIIRVDSEFIHSEVVKPVLGLLNESHYAGAQEEFLGAFEHYKKGKNKEALNDCLKSFESTMKAICAKRKWKFKPNSPAKKLIEICFDNGLIPSFWTTQFNSLRSMLESSIPTGRNQLSGHGQGITTTSIPDYLTSYMLHMTASTLVFLINAEKNFN